jgi:hypothetical protein
METLRSRHRIERPSNSGFDDRFEEAGLSAFRANGFDSDEASRETKPRI